MDAALTPSSDAELGEPTGPPPGAAPPAPVEPLAPPPADEPPELAAGCEAGPGKVTLCGKAVAPRQAALAGAA